MVSVKISDEKTVKEKELRISEGNITEVVAEKNSFIYLKTTVK